MPLALAMCQNAVDLIKFYSTALPSTRLQLDAVFGIRHRMWCRSDGGRRVDTMHEEEAGPSARVPLNADR